MEPTQALAKFAVVLRYDDVPAAVVHEAKRSILNWLGVAIGASHHETIDTALRAVRAVSTDTSATILGRDDRSDVLHAAFLNGTASHVFDFDDTHLETIIHPSGPVAAPLFALTDVMTVSGREFLTAFVAGVDVECRVGMAVYPAHYDIGWHITATTGVLGAAAGAGKLLELDATRMLHALGVAATQASGLRAMFGTMTKPFHVGRAAQSGLFAALLAREGFTSSTAAIEGRRGFANVLSSERDYDPVFDGLGERFELAKNAYKPFACGIVTHPAIDGAIRLRDEHGLTPQDVERVTIRVHPLVVELTGNAEPRTGLEGKFSVQHCVAMAILDGVVAEPQFADAAVIDPVSVALRRRVQVDVDAAIREDEALVTVEARDGRRLHTHVEHAIGSLERPMTDDELVAKYRSLVDPIIGSDNAERLADAAWRIESLPDVNAMLRFATPTPHAGAPIGAGS